MIIGITGTNGAGKDTLAEHVCKDFGYVHVSVREFLVAKLVNRGVEISRESLQNIANEIRGQSGSKSLIERVVNSLSDGTSGDYLFNSIRNVEALRFLKKRYNAVIVGVDASPLIRYERIVLRNGDIDDVSYEEFLELEQKEFMNTDASRQNLRGCLEESDYLLNNDGNQSTFYREISDLVTKIGSVQ